MPPVRALKNQYRGINAHLHSFWQATATWNRFHNAHITYLMESFQSVLIPLGYVAQIEESLQIRRIDENFSRRPKSDVVIYDTQRRHPAAPSATDAAELTVADLLEEKDTEHPYSALTIHPLSSDMEMGDAVAWIELLSPSNKGDGDDAATYVGKRRALLDAGLVFVELDYLHEMPPTFPRLLDYSRASERNNAHPYRIVVLDPRPNLRSGPADVHEFDVDVPIPTVLLPLKSADVIEFDFDFPYQQTFERSVYGYQLDYREFPVNFDRYSPADQRRIALRMLAVLEAARDGVDMEAAAPLPVKELGLEEAVRMVEAARQLV